MLTVFHWQCKMSTSCHKITINQCHWTRGRSGPCSSTQGLGQNIRHSCIHCAPNASVLSSLCDAFTDTYQHFIFEFTSSVFFLSYHAVQSLEKSVFLYFGLTFKLADAVWKRIRCWQLSQFCGNNPRQQGVGALASETTWSPLCQCLLQNFQTKMFERRASVSPGS